MIGEIWETITEGIGVAWDTIMEIPEHFSGFFTDVNMSGFLILAILGKIGLSAFWYYTVYLKGIENFLTFSHMAIGTIVTPIVCYIFAWRAGRQ